MKISRLGLLSLLKSLSPALAGAKNSLPELSCVWFSGTHASAFNDVLGIQVTFATEFTGGVLGDKLLGVLERSRAKEVDVAVEGEDALLKIGAARIKLTRRPIEDWFWRPEIPEASGFVVTKLFRDAVDLTLLSVGSASVLNPEQRGITVIQNGKTADLYSTDAVSLSWVRVDTSKQKVMEHTSRLILPTIFCEQLKSLKNEAELRFDENAVYCLTKFGEGDEQAEALIFSKLVEDDNPVSFEDVVRQHVGDEGGVEVPAQLKLRASRAMVLLGDQPVQIEVDDNHLYLFAQTAYGEVDDVLKIGDHPNVKVKIDMALLHRALDGRERMTIAEHGVVMTGPESFTHIISTK